MLLSALPPSEYGCDTLAGTPEGKRGWGGEEGGWREGGGGRVEERGEKIGEGRERGREGSDMAACM